MTADVVLYDDAANNKHVLFWATASLIGDPNGREKTDACSFVALLLQPHLVIERFVCCHCFIC